MTPINSSQAKPQPLPQLRGDLQIEDGGADVEGRPIAIVTDPIRNAYFRLYWPQSVVVLAWQSAPTVAGLTQILDKRYGVSLGPSEFDETLKFLFDNQLTKSAEDGGWSAYFSKASSQNKSAMQKLLHNYLFFRLPIFHPERFLKRLLPKLRFVYSRFFLGLCLSAVLLGGYLISRQWGTFVSMFADTGKLPSLAIFGAVLFILKAIHELGHALTTVRYGGQVPTVGVAFMLGTPVFYTDTSDSWRLTNRKHRLAIVFAGVGAEMILACFAVLLWPFLTDGIGRQLCFAVMTSALVTSIFINLNPCMRYDGYFALSDYLDIANLQPRAFEFGTWKLREILFDLGEPPPEDMSPAMQKTLILYAWTTWVYRVLLFTAIAVLLYSFVLKILGIALGLFEIVVFILLPAFREVKEWHQRRRQIMWRPRFRYSATLALIGLAAFFLPLDRSVEVPAALAAAREEAIHLHEPAQIQEVYIREGQVVKKGELLLRAISPELDIKIEKAKLLVRSVSFQIDRLAAYEKDQELALVLAQELKSANEKLAAFERTAVALSVRAPVAGHIVDLDSLVQPGVWQNPGTLVARIVDLGSATARGIVADTDVDRLQAGSKAIFVAENPTSQHRELLVSAIAPASNDHLPEPMLSDINGGEVMTTDRNGELIAAQGGFEISFVSLNAAPSQVERGVIHIVAKSESLAKSLWRQIARVLVRENGF